MTEELDVITAGKSLTWSEIWIKALTHRSVETYEEIISDPHAGQRRAYTWMIVCSLIGYILSFIVGSTFGSGVFEAYDESFGSLFFVFFCGIPIAIFASVFGIMITAGFSQFIAGLLGGRGTYDKLLYAFAAYLAPLTLITSVLGVIPVLNFLTMTLALYGALLNVTAIKAVHQFSWGRAVASSFSLLTLLLGIAALVAFVVLVLLLPAIDAR